MNHLAPTVELPADDTSLRARLAAIGVSMPAGEVRTLGAALERHPTRAELALFNSMWSEHCSYKSSRALLRRLPTHAANVVLGPGADAGIVRLPRVGPDGKARIDDLVADGSARCIAIGHESHNHPSQLLPYEGAATGIGGIVRDVYCMGADVIGVLDALRFGDPRGPQADSVRAIATGVMHGVAGYGNALGVPNLGGDVEFESRFDDNCLVNVVAIGTLDERDLIPSVAPQQAATEDYVLLLLGKPTDDSGLGGAAFASGVLDSDERTQQRGAVQLPDPFFKRVLTEANKVAFDFLRRHGAPFAVKDLGAAGLGGAASEMAAGAGLGLAIDLDLVHRVTAHEAAHVLLVAETQERYVLAVPASVVESLTAIYEHDFELGSMVGGAGVRAVGRFTAEPRFRVTQAGVVHVDVPSALIATAPSVEWPRTPRPVEIPAPGGVDPMAALAGRDVGADLARLVGSLAGASRQALFGHYDSDVQGRTMLRPGDGDAGVLLLRRDEPLAVAVGMGGASRWGIRDPRRAGAAAVCEAVRNVAAVGATPWALTDCLNYGSPENPHTMHDLEAGVEGLAAAARALGLRGQPGDPLPFVSGNVSLYNENHTGSAIPPMPIVACLGVCVDFSRVRGAQLVEPGDALYRIGVASTALGASLYAQATEQTALFESTPLPELDLASERQNLHAVLDAFDRGLVQACHDLGDGGLALAVLEMALGRAGRPALGVHLDLPADVSPDIALLCAEATGFLCEVRAQDASAFVEVCRTHRAEVARVGTVVAAPEFKVTIGPRTVLASRLEPYADLWKRGLENVFAVGGTA